MKARPAQLVSGRALTWRCNTVRAQVDSGAVIELRPRPGAGHVVRLGRTTFYERARRKLRLTDSAEIPFTAGERAIPGT